MELLSFISLFAVFGILFALAIVGVIFVIVALYYAVGLIFLSIRHYLQLSAKQRQGVLKSAVEFSSVFIFALIAWAVYPMAKALWLALLISFLITSLFSALFLKVIKN
ncbi:hypothetical protein A4G18_07480 [Pasteurellaceae bacterium Pebbles2]|nr:hypothetical protein [Pasteurellaceae bacterium Pebbles2]